MAKLEDGGLQRRDIVEDVVRARIDTIEANAETAHVELAVAEMVDARGVVDMTDDMVGEGGLQLAAAHIKLLKLLGRHTFVDRDSVIAAIPIGYADGLNRHLGNRHGYCLVNGQRADYVGNICMDVCMVDVTDVACREGDSVEIFGDHLPVTVLSDQLDTIPYEVLTGISNRVKRVYYL